MPACYRFGDVEVQPVERRVLVAGEIATIGTRAFDVLIALIERRGQTVSKNELLDLAWPGLVVEENNLQVQVSALRRLLGAGTVVTIPGVGYRFAARIEGDEPRVAGEASERVKPVGNIPAASEGLIGREDAVEAVAQMLRAQRLVTILGPAGIGKTRLAQEVARHTNGEYSGGCWWADLATIDSPERVVSAIAMAARLKLGPRDSAEDLAHAVGFSECLLVLDNCEHVVGRVAEVVRTLVGGAPRVRILATTQELLRIPGENVHLLDGLDLALASDAPAAARRRPALQLLERRARAADPRFRIDEGNVAQASALCRQLDGIALAIEMAAARIPVLGLPALVSRLGERLDLFQSPDRSAAARHRTLRATFEWSHSLLTEPEKVTLRRLAAFVGTFDLGRTCQVCGEPEENDDDVLERLSALVEKSLVKVESMQPPGYRLLETARLHGLESLEAHGETRTVMRGHAQAMGLLDAEIMGAFDREPEVDCARRYERHYDDLAAAFERSHRMGDADLAAGTVMSLTRLDLARGFLSPMRRRKDLARTMIEGASLEARARLAYCLAIGRFIPCPGVSRATASRWEVEAWRALGDRPRLFDALGRMAMNVGTSGLFTEAAELIAEARSIEDPGWSPQVRGTLAFHANTVAAYGTDLDHFARSLDEVELVAIETRSARVAALASMQRAEWLVSAGRLDEALARSPVAVATFRALGNLFGLCNSLATYADALLLSGDDESAVPLLAECVPLALRNGIDGWACDPLALLAARRGYPRHAARLLGYADACYARTEEVRRPWDARVAAECELRIGRALPADELARLREVGRGLGEPAVSALAEDLLPTRFKDTSGQAMGAAANLPA